MAIIKNILYFLFGSQCIGMCQFAISVANSVLILKPPNKRGWYNCIHWVAVSLTLASGLSHHLWCACVTHTLLKVFLSRHFIRICQIPCNSAFNGDFCFPYDSVCIFSIRRNHRALIYHAAMFIHALGQTAECPYCGAFSVQGLHLKRIMSVSLKIEFERHKKCMFSNL